jgi:altronate dehydratase
MTAPAVPIVQCAHTNITAGNKAGGLSNIVATAMGAALVKSGTAPFAGVVPPGGPADRTRLFNPASVT